MEENIKYMHIYELHIFPCVNWEKSSKKKKKNSLTNTKQHCHHGHVIKTTPIQKQKQKNYTYTLIGMAKIKK